jgi:peptide deformylase
MSLLDIRIVPDLVLRETCTRIGLIDARIKKLADDMLETMYHAPGIGLAAPQIGVTERMLVMDVADEGAPRKPYCLINPEIIWSSQETSVYKEGCLSIPEQYAEVTRPAEVRVRYETPAGTSEEMQASGLLATCVQHEIDHLNGVLFIDYLSRLKRDMILRKLAKLQRADEEG